VNDPFAALGLPFGAPLTDIRAARRRLARSAHPDHGGTEEAMKRVNQAFDAAVAHATGRRRLPEPTSVVDTAARATVDSTQYRPSGGESRRGSRRAHDHPSFTIDALPAEAFEALIIVASWIGKILVDEPPYQLDVHLYEPAECWCRLDLVPDAGASTVSITIASADDGPVPDVESVRDVWVDQLNRLATEDRRWPSQ
jgi:hypothetical protein